MPVTAGMTSKRKQWVALTGLAGSGKNAIAEHLVEQYGYTQLGFADAIRDAALALNPLVPIDMGHNGELIKSTMRLTTLIDSLGWEHAKRSVPEVRELLQRLGTDVGRDVISPEVWIDIAVRRASHIDGPVVFTDCRFPNEVDTIRNHGGLLVRVYRRGIEAVNDHISETAIDDITADLTVLNFGPPTELSDHARTIHLTLTLKGLHS